MITKQVAAAEFLDVVQSLGGKIKRDAGLALAGQLRATLPIERRLPPNDRLMPGVAMRVTTESIQVAPYVFRIICSNGAIFEHHRGTVTSLKVGAQSTEQEACEFIRFATENAASTETIDRCFEEMQTADNTPMPPFELDLTAIRAALRAFASERLENAVSNALSVEPRVRTRYDAMNAVTAAARDAQDPELKWQMESFATTLLTSRRQSVAERFGPRFIRTPARATDDALEDVEAPESLAPQR